jgi:hypothetical protein
MLTGHLNSLPLKALTNDGWLLFITRFTRLFAYGALSVILVLYLTSLGLSERQTGMDRVRFFHCGDGLPKREAVEGRRSD